MRTYESTMAEIAKLESRQSAISSKSNITAHDRDELMKLEGNIAQLRSIATEEHQREKTELRAAAERAVPVFGDAPLSANDREERDAFFHYLKTGEMRASLSSTDANGGFVIPNSVVQEIAQKARKADPIMAGATHFDLRGGNSTMELPYKLTHGVVTTATEAEARTEQNAPTFGSANLTCVDYYTDQRATQLWIDSTPKSEELLTTWIVEDILEQYSVDLAVGDGNGNAAGLFAGTSFYPVKLSGVADTIANTNFATLYTALPAKFRPNSTWIMNGTTLSALMAMDAPNTSATMPLVTFDASGTPRILGRPVLECSSAPDVGNGLHPIALADLSAAYATGTHFGPSVLVDQLTATPKIRFYGLGRLGGCPWTPDAAVILKSDNA